jgi:hypothetical protein
MKLSDYVSPKALLVEMHVDQCVLSGSVEAEREGFAWSQDESVFS